MLERLLTARELAELLGFQAGTIVDWAEAGKIPSYKLGGRLRFRESDVVEWLAERKRSVTSDVHVASLANSPMRVL